MDIKIIVAHHKPSLVIKDDVYYPLHVGKAISNVDLGLTGDNTGDNISFKNPIYCEMTAVYWAWKNLKADYIGLNHYRRYFTFLQYSRRYRFYLFRLYWRYKLKYNIQNPGKMWMRDDKINTNNEAEFRNNAFMFESKITELLKKDNNDLVYANPIVMPCMSVELFWCTLGRDLIYSFKDIVKEKYPKFYTYLCKILDGNKIYAANMFIMKWNLFDEYCNMAFDILQEHENRTLQSGWCRDLLKEKSYFRISGYLAELITSAYIEMLLEQQKKALCVNCMMLI